jgi:hypothetical protein
MVEKRDVILGLVMFFVNLFWAISQQWSVTDLLWSLWIASLLVGYSYILVSILAGLVGTDAQIFGGEKGSRIDAFGPGVVFNFFIFVMVLTSTGFSLPTLIMFLVLLLSIAMALSKETKKKLGLKFIPDFPPFISRLVFLLPMSLFFLGFFTIHFVGFHLAHSMLLNEFFPLVDGSLFDEGYDGFVGYIKNILQVSVSRYWVFIGFSVFSRWQAYAGAFRTSIGSSSFMPYKNVIRMHFTIFLIAALNAANASQYLLYVVFIIYFLPAADLFRLVFPKKSTASTSPEYGFLRKMSDSLIHIFRKKIKQ